MVLTKENVAAHAVAEVTTSKIAKALTLPWTFLLLIGTRFLDSNRSSLDAEVGFNKVPSVPHSHNRQSLFRLQTAIA